MEFESTTPIIREDFHDIIMEGKKRGLSNSRKKNNKKHNWLHQSTFHSCNFRCYLADKQEIVHQSKELKSSIQIRLVYQLRQILTMNSIVFPTWEQSYYLHAINKTCQVIQIWTATVTSHCENFSSLPKYEKPQQPNVLRRIRIFWPPFTESVTIWRKKTFYSTNLSEPRNPKNSNTALRTNHLWLHHLI